MYMSVFKTSWSKLFLSSDIELCIYFFLCFCSIFVCCRFTTQLQAQALWMVHDGTIGRKDERVTGASISSFMFYLLGYFLVFFR